VILLIILKERTVIFVIFVIILMKRRDCDFCDSFDYPDKDQGGNFSKYIYSLRSSFIRIIKRITKITVYAGK
jgi:hypothetical protein